MAEVKPAEVSAILRQQLSGFKSELELQEVGTVLQVGDGIARIYGLTNVQSGELVEFQNKIQAIVLNLEEDNVGVVLLGSSKGIKEGDTVKRTKKIVPRVRVISSNIVTSFLSQNKENLSINKTNNFQGIQNNAPYKSDFKKLRRI